MVRASKTSAQKSWDPRFAHPEGPSYASWGAPLGIFWLPGALPSQVPGPALLGLGTKRLPQHETPAFPSPPSGILVEALGDLSTRWRDSQGPALRGSRFPYSPFRPAIPLCPRSPGPPGAGSVLGQTPPPREARADSLRSEDGAFCRAEERKKESWGWGWRRKI